MGRQPNCSDPFPVCPSDCQPGCTCPEDTVIDEIQNRCVPLTQCSKIKIYNYDNLLLICYFHLISTACPPQCSHDYCSAVEGDDSVDDRDSLVPCMR